MKFPNTFETSGKPVYEGNKLISMQNTRPGSAESTIKSTPISSIFKIFSTSFTKVVTSSSVRLSVSAFRPWMISLFFVENSADLENDNGHFFRRSIVYLSIGFYK